MRIAPAELRAGQFVDLAVRLFGLPLVVSLLGIPSFLKGSFSLCEVVIYLILLYDMRNLY